MSYLGQPKYETMLEILQALQPLQLDDFDQRTGFLWWDNDGEATHEPDCKMCVGLTIAEKCELPRDIEEDGAEEANWYNGLLYVARAAAILQVDVDALLHRHGAPEEPFGSSPWQKRPFEVLKAAFEEILGEPIELPERTAHA